MSLTQNMNRIAMKLHSKKIVSRNCKKQQKQEKISRKNINKNLI